MTSLCWLGHYWQRNQHLFIAHSLSRTLTGHKIRKSTRKISKRCQTFAIQSQPSHRKYINVVLLWPKLSSSTYMWYCLLRCTRWIKMSSLSIKPSRPSVWPFKMKAIAQYFHVVPFTMLSGGSKFNTLPSKTENLSKVLKHLCVWAFKWKLLSNTFSWSSFCYTIQDGSKF